jgi:hypothetical protein
MIQSSMQLRSLIRLLYHYDVAESIDLAKLRGLLDARGGSAELAFPRRTPGFVRFEQAPIAEPAEFVTVCPGVSAACPVKYYGFGAHVRSGGARSHPRSPRRDPSFPWPVVPLPILFPCGLTNTPAAWYGRQME